MHDCIDTYEHSYSYTYTKCRVNAQYLGLYRGRNYLDNPQHFVQYNLRNFDSLMEFLKCSTRLCKVPKCTIAVYVT